MHLLRSMGFMMMALLILASCTVGPNYHRPCQSLPSQYIFNENEKESSFNNTPWTWWNCFGDPVLVTLINRAVCGNNLDIQGAQAKIREARAALNVANGYYFPELNASGRVVRDHLSGNGELLSNFENRIPLTYTDYTAGFDASWELDIFGHTRRSSEAACARMQSAVENRRAVTITIAAEVARLYTQYRVYQQRIVIAHHSIDSYVSTLRLVKLQWQAGFATSVDLHRVESEVLSAKAALPPLQAEARATLAALAVLVGDYPETLYKQLILCPAPIPTMQSPYLSVGLPSELLQRRPDVRMAERELAAATADIGVAVANQFPRFQLVGDLGFDTVFPGTYFLPASRYWSIGPSFTMPIFQGGRLLATVKEREATRDILFAKYKKSILEALSDVETAMVRYDRERIRKQALRAAADKLKSTVNLIQLQYREGDTTLINVLDVERQLDGLSDQYAQSTGLVTTDLISLYKALGGGWSC